MSMNDDALFVVFPHLVLRVKWDVKLCSVKCFHIILVRTGQGPCRAILHKCGIAKSPTCNCGQQQTMSHIVNTCPLTEF